MRQELERRAAPSEHAVNTPSGLSLNKMHNPTFQQNILKTQDPY